MVVLGSGPDALCVSVWGVWVARGRFGRSFETIPRWRELVQSGSVAAQPAHGTVCAPCRYCAHAGTYWCPRGNPLRPTVDSQQHGLIPDSSMETSQTHISRAPYPVRATRAAAEQEGKHVAHPRAASLSAIRMYFTPAEILVVWRRCLTTAAGVRTCRASHSVAHSHACERAQALSLADFWRRCRHTSLT